MHAVNLPDWARDRSVTFSYIDPARTALLVIDLQNAFLEPDGCLPIATGRDVVPNVNRLTKGFRDAGSFIVFIRHTISDDPRYVLNPERKPDNFPKSDDANLREGHRDHGLYGGLDVQAGDLVINKHRYSAMLPNSSELHEILGKRGIDTIVVCGAATNVCCESTARDAAMLDYRVFFAEDATATLNDELHNAALLNLCILFADVRSTDGVLALLQEK